MYTLIGSICITVWEFGSSSPHWCFGEFYTTKEENEIVILLYWIKWLFNAFKNIVKIINLTKQILIFLTCSEHISFKHNFVIVNNFITVYKSKIFIDDIILWL